MTPFNKPYLTGKEAHYMYKAVMDQHLSGNGPFTKQCQRFFQERYGFKKCLLTTSGTDALEMCAMLCDLKPGDEVIVPSYTFVSTALAFLREGAKVVFADSMKRNPNLDAETLEALITPRTRVIAPVHYAGVACDMDAIMAIAEKHNLIVVEDAAQAIDSYYRPLTPNPSPLMGKGDARTAYQTGDPMLYAEHKQHAREMRVNPTDAEAALWNYLRDEQLGYKFRRQHMIEDYIADFACLDLRVVIEVDGGYHNTTEQNEHDAMRDRILAHYGFQTLRFTNEEVLCNIDDTIARIKFALDYRRKYLTFTEGYGVADGCPSGGNQRKGLPLGGIGHLAAFSFHETKNVTAGGEGGLLVVNDERFVRRAEIIWEKGTNRAEFFRGAVNKYGWVDMGSSFLPAEINAAFLWAQLENLDEIQNKRKQLWNTYYEHLSKFASASTFTLPDLPEYGTNNAHMFYLVCRNLEERTGLIAFLKEHDVQAPFHYLSLHKSEYYQKLLSKWNQSPSPLGEGWGEVSLPECDRYADTLVRLPMYYELTVEEVENVCQLINDYYSRKQNA